MIMYIAKDTVTVVLFLAFKNIMVSNITWHTFLLRKEINECLADGKWKNVALISRKNNSLLEEVVCNLLNLSTCIFLSPMTILLPTMGSIQFHLFNQGQSWSWSYGRWIYNCLCNQCIIPLTFCVRIPLMTKCTHTALCD